MTHNYRQLDRRRISNSHYFGDIDYRFTDIDNRFGDFLTRHNSPNSTCSLYSSRQLIQHEQSKRSRLLSEYKIDLSHYSYSRVNEERSYDPRDRSCNSNHVDIRDNNSYLQKRSSNSYHDENESPSFPRNRSSREPSVIGRTSFCATSSSTGSRNVTSSTGVNYSDERYDFELLHFIQLL